VSDALPVTSACAAETPATNINAKITFFIYFSLLKLQCNYICTAARSQEKRQPKLPVLSGYEFQQHSICVLDLLENQKLS
jgi:hypothetical protein